VSDMGEMEICKKLLFQDLPLTLPANNLKLETISPTGINVNKSSLMVS